MQIRKISLILIGALLTFLCNSCETDNMDSPPYITYGLLLRFETPSGKNAKEAIVIPDDKKVNSEVSKDVEVATTYAGSTSHSDALWISYAWVEDSPFLCLERGDFNTKKSKIEKVTYVLTSSTLFGEGKQHTIEVEWKLNYSNVTLKSLQLDGVDYPTTTLKKATGDKYIVPIQLDKEPAFIAKP